MKISAQELRLAEHLARLLMTEEVFPVVAEVIRIHYGRVVPAPAIGELLQRNLPPRHDRTVLRVVLGGDADRHYPLLRCVEQPELVKVGFRFMVGLDTGTTSPCADRSVRRSARSP